MVAWLTHAWGRTGLGQLSWQNLAEFSRLGGIWQNIAEYGGKWHITVDYCRLWQSHGEFLVAKSVETGGRV